MKNSLSKILSTVAVVMMGLTAALTLLSGAGTTCVALAAEKFGGKMARLAPYQWLYVLFVLLTLGIGVLGVRSVVSLIKGRSGSYRSASITLASGIVVGGIHMAASRALRGSSMPVDSVVYTTVITLVYFLALRLPGLRARLDFEKTPPDPDLPPRAAALSLLLSGVMMLTVQLWAGPTHIFGGINDADVWHTQLGLIGWAMIAAGLGLLIKSLLNVVVPLWVPGKPIDRYTALLKG